jgi:DivIVA domain-containing protein
MVLLPRSVFTAEKRVNGMRNSAERGRNQQFKLAMRGYDPNEVDAFLAQLYEDSDLPAPGFSRVMRGYDAEQVDLHIENVKALGYRPAP